MTPAPAIGMAKDALKAYFDREEARLQKRVQKLQRVQAVLSAGEVLESSSTQAVDSYLASSLEKYFRAGR